MCTKVGSRGESAKPHELLFITAEGIRIEGVEQWWQELRIEKEALTRPWGALCNFA